MNIRIGALLATLFFLSWPPATAKKLYSYQDENGQWHFSDTRPLTHAKVAVKRLKVHEQTEKMRVSYVDEASGRVHIVHNDYPGPIQVAFQLLQPSNAVVRPTLPRAFVVPAQSSIRTFTISSQDPGQPTKYTYRREVVLGSPNAIHDDEEHYRLPYASGTRFLISQAFNGPYSHNSAHSQYAVDFAMPDGTPIHAARSGIVMEVARDYYSGGTDPEKYGTRANYVRILHDDGSFSIYAHLRWESVVVVPGAQVRRGQMIAQSGNTGYSTGPHLHFAVQINRDMALVSLPFRFEVANKVEPVVPRTGLWLVAQ